MRLPRKPHPPVRCSVITFQHCMEGLKTQHPLLRGLRSQPESLWMSSCQSQHKFQVRSEREREITAETFPCPVLWENLLFEWPINIDQQILLFGVRHSAFGRTCLLAACRKKECWHQNITPSCYRRLAQSTSSVEVLCQISL